MRKRWLTANFRNAVGPRMHFSGHVPNGYLTVMFNWLLNLKMNGSISHGSEYSLCIRVEAYFYGWCDADPDFGIWSEEMGQLKSSCLVLSGSVNSKAAYWPNTSSWQIIAAGHTQTSARLGEISHFEFHICFKYIGHMASSTKKCDHETSSFCVVFGSLGVFLTSTFPALKHHQPFILLQSASQLQLSIGAFGKTKLQKLLVCVLESRLLSMDGATQIPISAFEASRWHNSWVCVWRFQGL